MVREKFLCRDCQTITQPRAPFHVTPPAAAPSQYRAWLETHQQQLRDVLGQRAIRLVPRLNGWCEKARVRNIE